MKLGKKKIETFRATGWARGPERSAKRGAEAGAEARGPSRPSEKFQLFFTEFHEYHLWFSNFLAKNIREYHQKSPNNQ